MRSSLVRGAVGPDAGPRRAAESKHRLPADFSRRCRSLPTADPQSPCPFPKPRSRPAGSRKLCHAASHSREHRWTTNSTVSTCSRLSSSWRCRTHRRLGPASEYSGYVSIFPSLAAEARNQTAPVRRQVSCQLPEDAEGPKIAPRPRTEPRCCCARRLSRGRSRRGTPRSVRPLWGMNAAASFSPKPPPGRRSIDRSRPRWCSG